MCFFPVGGKDLRQSKRPVRLSRASIPVVLKWKLVSAWSPQFMKRHQNSVLRLFSARLLNTALLLAVLSATRFSSAQEPKLSPEKQPQIEAAISKFMASTHVPGLSAAVVEDGRFEWAAGFAMADLENNVPATEHTLYRLASISKSLTATAAMQLFERGQLDLDAPVQKYCPSFPQKPWPITTRQVMAHLSGIRHYKSGSQELRKADRSWAELF
ncbi:MAG: hypothetical protein DMG76_16690 [Acidobacteria bacterium]|nr:MAG: hypothetical protein DMG76_16690 [Acidobacteriota bacterium]